MSTFQTVTVLGDAIKEFRKASNYRGPISFAQQAGISKEGLRKIENGERLPTRETLTKLLEAGEVPKRKRMELHQIRDRAQAKRDGLDVPNYANDSDLADLAGAAINIFSKYLGDYDMEIPDGDQRFLKAEVTEAFKERVQ